MVEQTEIARKLGISGTKFRRIVQGRLEFQLINNKRHYDYEQVLQLIRNAAVFNMVNATNPAEDKK